MTRSGLHFEVFTLLHAVSLQQESSCDFLFSQITPLLKIINILYLKYEKKYIYCKQMILFYTDLHYITKTLRYEQLETTLKFLNISTQYIHYLTSFRGIKIRYVLLKDRFEQSCSETRRQAFADVR